jgi:hypothetical protein
VTDDHDHDIPNADIDSARLRLAALWRRAMSNDITPDEALVLRRDCMYIAVQTRGIERVRPFPDWDVE